MHSNTLNISTNLCPLFLTKIVQYSEVYSFQCKHTELSALKILPGILQTALYTVLYSVSTVSVQITMYNSQFTSLSVQFTDYTTQITVYTLQCTIYSIQFQCTVYIIQFTVNCVLEMHNKAQSDLLRETEQAALSVLGLQYNVQFLC